jgi:hypothetical protein
MLFESGALETVEGVGYTLSTADDTLVLVITERTFVAGSNKGGRADVRVPDGTFQYSTKLGSFLLHLSLNQLLM